MSNLFTDFLATYEAAVIPMTKAYHLAYFDATISGKDEDFEESGNLELKLVEMLSNKKQFQILQKIRAAGLLDDPLLQRQFEVIYNQYLVNQIDEKKLIEIVKLQNKVQKCYSTFRVKVDGKVYTDNEIEQTLRTTQDSNIARKFWLASKEIGGKVEPDVLTLVRMRNETARELGFENYHVMRLTLNEQNPLEVEKIFNELDLLTRESFANAKDEIDLHLAKHFKIQKNELMPWHYQNRYFQDAPTIYDIDLNKYYKDKDVVKLTADYFDEIGLPISDMVEKSDLFEKEGKYQHAYCLDVDREGDIRVLCNVKPNYNWMSTMLHEYGHAVYDKFISSDTPWVLREPAHIFTTEAIAMLFGRLASNAHWMDAMFGIPQTEKKLLEEIGKKILRLEQLVFSRWVQVVYRFEKAMYENPEQNLNAMWWDLVEEYQMLRRPENRNEPDWVSKIHLALYPAYYQNYMLGELLASQLYYHIRDKELTQAETARESFAGQKNIGQYLIEAVFKPANKLHWSKMIENATGEKLTAKYFAQQFIT